MFGIFLDVDLGKKIKINLSAGFDLWKVSYDGEFDFSEIRNGKHNGMLGVGVKYKDYGGYFQESFKVYSGSMEYVRGTNTSGVSYKEIFLNVNGDFGFSYSVGEIIVYSFSITGNLYYEGNK